MADVLLPTLTTWGWLVRKSRVQLQRDVFSPRVLSLLMSFEGTMVLNSVTPSMAVPFMTQSKSLSSGNMICSFTSLLLTVYDVTCQHSLMTLQYQQKDQVC